VNRVIGCNVNVVKVNALNHSSKIQLLLCRKKYTYPDTHLGYTIFKRNKIENRHLFFNHFYIV